MDTLPSLPDISEEMQSFDCFIAVGLDTHLKEKKQNKNKTKTKTKTKQHKKQPSVLWHEMTI